MPIRSWDLVGDGSLVIEDTYNEVYTIFTRDGKRYLRQVGWQIDRGQSIPENSERLIDFDPDCMYDQPWYQIG